MLSTLFTDSKKQLTSLLRFAAAVGLSYGCVWAFANFASSGNKNKQRALLSCSDNAAPCEVCTSRLAALMQQRAELPQQAQLLLSILERLLSDRGIELPSAASGDASSVCTCAPSSSSSSSLLVPVPCIPIAARFESLASPAVFYQTLLHKISTAQHRIVISSLYIGSGPRSKQLVETLKTRIREVGGRLKVVIVLDYCRMKIGPNLDAVRPVVEEMNAVPATAAEATTEQKQSVSLFCPPSAVGLMFSRFGRVREAQGVQHTKLFVFDNDVILSGANLSDDYFLDRMDRYILIQEQQQQQKQQEQDTGYKQLADHMTKLAETLSSVSFQLLPSSSSSGQQGRRVSEVCCNGKMTIACNDFDFGPNQPAAEAKKVHAAAMQEFEQATSVPLAKWLDALREAATALDAGDNKKKTFVVPSVQFARANVFTDMSVIEALLSFKPAAGGGGSSINSLQRIVASPYLNTHTSFLDHIFASCSAAQQEQEQEASSTAAAAAPQATSTEEPHNNNNNNNNNNNKKSHHRPPPLVQQQQKQQQQPAFRFVTCSPNSNAWKGSSGLAGALPQLYYSLVRSFFFLVEDRRLSQHIEIREFEKYHLVDPTDGEYHDMPEGATASAFSPYVRPDDEEEDNGDGAASQQQQQSAFSSPSPASRNIKKFPERALSCEEVAELRKTHGVASATFHAKGMWIADESAVPFATVLGSNNLGERCVYKDVECDFVLVTADPAVQTVLAEEVAALVQHSEPVSRSTLLSNSSEGKLGRFQPVVEVVGSMMSSYL